MIEYKGYYANIELDPEERLFHGEVINLRDVITFQADCVEDLIKEFQDSVDDYLEFCVQRGEEPERPFSGKFLLRLNCDLHKQIYIMSKLSNKSLNSWIAERLEKAVSEERHKLPA